MKISAGQLSGQLKRGLARIYLLCGDEPLQMMEAADAVREAAKSAGYLSREVLFAESGFDWSVLQEARDAFSLFGDSRVLDLRLPAKPDKEAAAALVRYAERPPDDAILLVSTVKLTGSDLKARWFQAVESKGVVVQVWPLDHGEFFRWLDRRLAAKGLLTDPSGLTVLAARVEGNLLAAVQEIEKLHILYGPGRLDDEMIVRAVADNARYDVFDLAEEVLRGQAAKAYRVLMGLKAEGVAAPVALWALTRELRLVADLKAEIGRGAGPEAAFAKYKIWDKRKPPLTAALKRLGKDAIHRSLLLSARADRVAKGLEAGDEWDALLDVCISLAEPTRVLPSSEQVAVSGV